MLKNLAIDERLVLSLTDEPTAYSQITREPFGMIFLLLVFHFDKFLVLFGLGSTPTNIRVMLAKPVRKGKKEDKRISNSQKSKAKISESDLMSLKTSKTLSLNSDYLIHP